MMKLVRKIVSMERLFGGEADVQDTSSLLLNFNQVSTIEPLSPIQGQKNMQVCEVKLRSGEVIRIMENYNALINELMDDASGSE